VQGFIAALAGNSDIAPALQWVAPSERSLLSELQGIKFNISVEDFAVVSTTPDPHDPNRAVVHVKGSVRYCFSGTPAGVPINTCEPFPFSAASRSDTVGAVKVNGDWYVSFSPAGPAPNPTLSCSGAYSSMPAPECTPTSSPSRVPIRQRPREPAGSLARPTGRPFGGSLPESIGASWNERTERSPEGRIGPGCPDPVPVRQQNGLNVVMSSDNGVPSSGLRSAP